MGQARARTRRTTAAVSAAVALAAPGAARARSTVAVPPFWRSLARCETNGHWDWGRFAGTPRARPGEGTTFEGGLGFYWGTWDLWRKRVGVGYAYAWQAPPLVQVYVAAWGLAHGGYWGCLQDVPRSRYPSWPKQTRPRWLGRAWPYLR